MARGELIDTPSWIRLLAKATVPRDQRERFRAMLADERRAFERSHGYDVFGAHPDGAAVAHFITSFLYDRWFRVRSQGHEHIPAEGPVIVAANHSGTLPFDAMMMYADLLRRTDPPRLPRAVADSFVAGLPFVGMLFARAGAVGGARRHRALARPVRLSGANLGLTRCRCASSDRVTTIHKRSLHCAACW